MHASKICPPITGSLLFFNITACISIATIYSLPWYFSHVLYLIIINGTSLTLLMALANLHVY